MWQFWGQKLPGMCIIIWSTLDAEQHVKVMDTSGHNCHSIHLFIFRPGNQHLSTAQNLSPHLSNNQAHCFGLDQDHAVVAAIAEDITCQGKSHTIRSWQEGLQMAPVVTNTINALPSALIHDHSMWTKSSWKTAGLHFWTGQTNWPWVDARCENERIC